MEASDSEFLQYEKMTGTRVRRTRLEDKETQIQSPVSDGDAYVVYIENHLG